MISRGQAERAGGWAVGGAALLFFALTTSRHAVPDASVVWVAQHLQLTPFPPVSHPLWSWCIRALAAVSGPSFPLVLNLFSACCGALAVGLLFRLVGGLRLEAEVERHAPLLAPAAGLVAALALATCIPFWIVSNRAHPASFDLAILLGALILLRAFARGGSRRALFASATLCALGAADAAALVLAAPVLGVYMLYLIWRRGAWNARTLAGWAACLLLGPLTLLLAAAEFARLPAAQWREFPHFGEVLRYYLTDYRTTLVGAVPKHGWLLLFMATALPWGLAQASVGRRGIDRGWSGTVLYVVLTGLALVVLFDGPVAPWRLVGTTPLLVMSYLLVAACLGLMAIRWGSMLVQHQVAHRRRVWPVAALATLVALAQGGAAAFRHARLSDTRSAADVQALAARMLDNLDGRSYFISDGLMEAPLVVEARRRGQPLHLLDARVGDLEAYRRYLASLMPTPRLQATAAAGLGPMVLDWLRSGEGAADQLAIELSPDVWIREGYEPVPAATAYLGAPDRASLDPDRVAEQAAEFGTAAQAALNRMTNGPAAVAKLASQLALRWSRLANNTGVFLENEDRTDAAAAAYGRALDLWDRNVSAALNLLDLQQRQGATQEHSRARALVEAERDSLQRVSPMELAARCGHVRRREAVLLVWDLTHTVTSAAGAAWQDAVNSYLRGNRADARRRVEKLVDEYPDQDEGWLLLARLAYEEGDAEGVQRCLRQMRTLGREWPALLTILGRQALDRGDAQAAREYFDRVTQLLPRERTVLELLMGLHLRAGEWDEAERSARKLMAIQTDHPAANRVLARVLAREGRADLAEDTLRHVTARYRDADALADLAELLMQRGALSDAQETAAAAVRVDPASGVAHGVQGQVLLQAGRAVEARAALLKAEELGHHDLAAQVALVQALAQAGDRAEAQRRAVALLQEEKDLTRAQREELEALRGPDS